METLALSDAMLHEFQEGCLAPLREYVCNDDTLSMRFLGRQVEVDYRGQVIIKIWQIGNKYSIYTMPFFNRYLDPAEGDNMDKILSLIPHYKKSTDDLLWEDADSLGEQRQKMEQVNNRAAGLSRQTDYYLVASDYHRPKSKEARLPGIDAVALKGFVGEDDTIVPELSLALIQICMDQDVPGLEEQAYWDADLETALAGYIAFTEALDKGELARDLAQDEEWVQALKENITEIFRQKCELGLIDRYLEPNAAVNIAPGPPEVDLVAVNMNPRKIGITSQLFRLAVEGGPGEISIFRASPMGMALYEDNLQPLSRYLAEAPAPRRRLREPNVLEPADAARLHASAWLLDLVRTALAEKTALDWNLLAECLFRMESFIVELQKREQGVLDALGQENERLVGAIKQLAAAEDALSTMEQVDSVELEAGEASDEMRNAADEMLRKAGDAVRAALGSYDLPETTAETEA